MKLVALAVLATAVTVSRAQPPEGFGVCVPQSQRAGRDVGCFILTEQKVGALESNVYWHVTELEALPARKTYGQGTVVTAYGKTWLMVLAGKDWRPSSGHHLAAIGPLPVEPGVQYSALYMDASMKPGMKSSIHRHSGVEAWYTMSGETCLETPQGASVGRAGEAPVIIPEGLPMELTATGASLRTSLVLILHRSAQKPTTLVSEWKPKGLCKPPGAARR